MQLFAILFGQLFAQVATAPEQLPPLGPGMSAMLGSLGPAGGVVIVVIYFLRYSSHREAAYRKSLEKIVDRVEKMEENNRLANEKMVEGFTKTVQEVHEEHRKTIDWLADVQKDTGVALGHVTERVDVLGGHVERLGEQITNQTTKTEELGQKVTQLDRSVGELRSRRS